MAVFYSETETIAQTSLHVTQDYRLHTSPVSRDVINYTYIDRNSIHYSWAAQRQRYFPPFQHDEKILNNSPHLQMSAFQRSRLTLKRLKSEPLSYRESLLGPNMFQTVGGCLVSWGGVFVLLLSAAFKAFRWNYSFQLERIGVYCLNQPHKSG